MSISTQAVLIYLVILMVQAMLAIFTLFVLMAFGFKQVTFDQFQNLTSTTPSPGW